MENDLQNAWHQFEQTGKIEDYLHYCAASNTRVSFGQGTVTETEDGHAVQIKGDRSEVPPDWRKR